MFRHMLPNAMVATLTLLPFIVTGTIGALASLDFLGFGLPSSAPSLGEMTLQAKNNLQAPWLASPRSSPSRSCCRCWSSSSRACATPSTRERPSREPAPAEDARENRPRFAIQEGGPVTPILDIRNLTVGFRRTCVCARRDLHRGRARRWRWWAKAARASRSRRSRPCRCCPTAPRSAGRSRYDGAEMVGAPRRSCAGARQRHQLHLPGADDLAQPAAHAGKADRRKPALHQGLTGRRRARGSSNC
jgi:hypothetical protein